MDKSYLFKFYSETQERKKTLVQMILGTFHMDNYYKEWVDHKMTDFETFYGHLDQHHQCRYDYMNNIYILVRDKK